MCAQIRANRRPGEDSTRPVIQWGSKWSGRQTGELRQGPLQSREIRRWKRRDRRRGVGSRQNPSFCSTQMPYTMQITAAAPAKPYDLCFNNQPATSPSVPAIPSAQSGLSRVVFSSQVLAASRRSLAAALHWSIARPAASAPSAAMSDAARTPASKTSPTALFAWSAAAGISASCPACCRSRRRAASRAGRSAATAAGRARAPP